MIRVYFAALDRHKYGRIGYVDWDSSDPQQVLYEAPEPVLDVGEAGLFDDSGVYPSCVVNHAGRKYLYYIGWQRCERVPYMLFSGLAMSDDGGVSFQKHSRVPILDRTDPEPFSRSAPFVLLEDQTWKMWYWSCLGWSEGPQGVHYNNVLRHAVSPDGIHWESHPHSCVEPDFEDEYSIGRPWVVKEASGYQMWYSVRSFSRRYRIGYGESSDGIHWVRKDREAGIDVSESGWDSEMICFSSIVGIGAYHYLFYNGNRYGQTGFGYATSA